VKHNIVFFTFAKIVKGIENIFIKPLARKKNLCIFALGFRIILSQTTSRYLHKILKIKQNEQKNVPTIEKKKKKQTRIHGQNGICKRT
jgi:hypothetical protein